MRRFILFFVYAALLSACSSPSSSSGASLAIAQAKREAVLAHALLLMGTPYRYGGNTPSEGFDCSGYVRYVIRQATNVNTPRTTRDIAAVTSHIRKGSLRPGDFVFFNTSGPYTHMGIYVGDEQFIHAPSSRNQGVVRIDSMNNHYFSSRFIEARTAFR